MAYFKVRNTGNDDGTYTLSYGKGKKKLSATMVKDGGWCATSDRHTPIGPYKTMKECKSAWGEWAAKTYHGEADEPAKARPTPAPPSLPSGPRTGPFAPKLSKPGTPPTLKPKRDEHVGRYSEVDRTEVGASDPFDPLFHTRGPDGKHLITPIGALDEIYQWCRRNPHRVLHSDGKTLLPPFNVVLTCLRRESGREYGDISRG